MLRECRHEQAANSAAATASAAAAAGAAAAAATRVTLVAPCPASWQMVEGLKVQTDKKAAAEQIKGLYRLFCEKDCTMVEVRSTVFLQLVCCHGATW